MKFLTQDYYEILDVAPGADNEAVKRAYRLVRRSFRPDSMAIHSLYSEGETEAIGAKIDEAFRILSRPESAGRYAKYHRTGRPGTTIPRRPEDFFDQVHQLDAATPIEALARAVGGQVDVEEVPPARVAQLRPRRPVRTTSVDITDALHEEPSFADVPVAEGLAAAGRHEAVSAVGEPQDAGAGLVPDSQIDLFLDALEEVEDFADVPDSPAFVAAAVVEDDADLPFGAVEDIPPSRPLDFSDVDALLSTVAANPVAPARPAFAPAPVEATPAFTPAPPAPAFVPAPARAEAPPTYAAPLHAEPPTPEPARPAIRARVPVESFAPPPKRGANVQGTEVDASVGLVPESSPAPYRRPAPHAAPPPMVSATLPANTGPTAFASAQTTPTTPPVQGPGPGSATTLASVAAVQRDFGPRSRRWSRDTVRTRAVGQLQFEPLSAEDIEAFEMDCGGMGGAFITAVRRAVGVNIEDIASRTKISTGMLRYIEGDEVEFLPARVYLRGYLTQVGRLLKLPVPRIVDGYMQANGLGKK